MIRIIILYLILIYIYLQYEDYYKKFINILFMCKQNIIWIFIINIY